LRQLRHRLNAAPLISLLLIIIPILLLLLLLLLLVMRHQCVNVERPGRRHRSVSSSVVLIYYDTKFATK